MNAYQYTSPLILETDRPVLEEKPALPPRFSRVFWISWAIFLLITRSFQSRFWKRITPQERATEIRQFLEKMGGLWIKVGQVLAMRTDLFSPEFCTELSRLQDRASTFPEKVSIGIIEKNLGCPLENVFDIFQPKPFAAASLSQVHKARLRNEGEWVVVKVQRPFALDYFRYDLRWLNCFVWLLKFLGLMKHLRLDVMLEQVNEMMVEELDYRNEAGNMRRLKPILKQHRIVVPRIYWEYSTERVLVMEYLKGVFMSDYIQLARQNPTRASEWLAENEIEPKKVARRLFQSVMRQLYEDLFFHADLHPGNIILLRNNRFAFIDFGNCGKVDKKLAKNYHQYFRAVSEQDLDKAIEYLIPTMGKLPSVDMDALKKRLMKVLDKQISRSYIKNLTYRERSIGSSSAEMNRVMAEFEIEVNWDMLKMARAFESVDQNLSVLNPNFNFSEEMRRYQNQARCRWQVAQVCSMPKAMADFANFSQNLLPSVLQRFQNMGGIGGSVSKGIQILTAIFAVVRKVLIISIAGIIWTYLYQHHYRLVDDFHRDEKSFLTAIGFTKLENAAPRAAPEFWFLLAFIIFIIVIWLKNLNKKLLDTKTEG